MARLDINRSGEIEVFIRVIERGTLSGAASALGMTPSAVSKLIGRLEDRLGAADQPHDAQAATDPGRRGLLRERRPHPRRDRRRRTRGGGGCCTTRPAARQLLRSVRPDYILPILPAFLALHPEIVMDVMLTDKVVDLVEERADVAIRAGPLRDSRLVARKLWQSRMVIVGSPAYLARRGVPRSPADLAGHNCLGFCFARLVDGWPLLDASGRVTTVTPSGNALVSDGEAMRLLALAGLGLGRLSRYNVHGDIAAGLLVPVLEEFNPGDEEPLHAIYVGQGGHLPARVRAFLDFLAASVRPPG